LADIFLNHSSKDKELVDALVQLIEGGIGIRSNQIFCTSLEDQGIPPGVDFKTHIQNQIGNAQTVVAVVSSQYYASAFCMCELGATWALVKEFIPLLVPPVDYSDLRGTLFGSQALPIDQDIKLDTMQSVLVKLSSHPEKVSRWNSRKKQFLDGLPVLLKLLPPTETLSLKQAEKLIAERNAYQQDFEKADLDIVALKKQVGELEKAKDYKAVVEIRRKYTDHNNEFEALVNQTQRFTTALPQVVREALYDFWQHRDFIPGDFAGADEAIEYKLLKTDGHTLRPNEDHPKVQRAIEAIKLLSDFVSEPPENFASEYREEHDDLFDITNKSFWMRHKLL